MENLDPDLDPKSGSQAGSGSGIRIQKKANLWQAYYGPSFEQLVGKAAEIRAKRIASHAEAQFLHPEFGTKLFVRTVVKKLRRDGHLLNELPLLVRRKYLKKGRLHAFLVDGNIGHHSSSPETNGIAWVGTVCGKNLMFDWLIHVILKLLVAYHFAGSLPFSLVKYTSSDIETGQTLAHELAHNLGIGHDFQVMKGRSLGTCGPGTYAPGGALMNYGRPLGKTWSDCSREDFQYHFNQQQPFCLKKSKQDSLVLSKLLHSFSIFFQGSSCGLGTSGGDSREGSAHTGETNLTSRGKYTSKKLQNYPLANFLPCSVT